MITVCILGFHDPRGTRAWTLSTGLRGAGFGIAECRTTKRGFFPKMADLWSQARRADCGAIVVMFPGQYLMPLAWILGKLKRVPVVLDAFISLHDTMVTDRAKVAAGSAKARFLALVDRVSCMLADRVLLDTPEHAAFFSKTFGVPERKIIVVPVGYRADVLSASPQPERAANEPLRALFYGTFIPLQGIDVILRAMKILQDDGAPISLELVGDGQTAPAMRDLATELGLTNVAFLGAKPLAEIATMQRAAHCGLGIFGTTPKAQRVIPHKAYDVLAMGRPLVTADTPASRRMLKDGVDALLVPPGDHAALATALKKLLADPALCRALGERSAAIAAGYAPERVVAPLAAALMLGSKG